MLQRLFPEKQPTKQLKQQNSQQIKLLKNNVKTKSVSGENSTNAKEIRNTYFTSEKTRNIKRIKTSIIKWNTTKYLYY